MEIESTEEILSFEENPLLDYSDDIVEKDQKKICRF